MIARLLRTFVLFFCISIVLAYYGDPNNPVNVPFFISSGSTAIGDKIYLVGGQIADYNLTNVRQDMLTLGFSQNGTLEVNRFTPQKQRKCFPCASYALPGNSRIVAINPPYAPYNITGTNITIFPAGLGLYDISSNSWTYPQDPTQFSNITHQSLPSQRNDFTTAISPQSDAIYYIGGVDLSLEKPATDIYRFDLKNMSSVINMTSMNPNPKISINGGSSQMLPNGIIVIAFGYNGINNEMNPTNQVTLYDTTTNRIYNQSVSGSPPEARILASSALGPDKTTIYYYGGGDQKILNTLFAGRVTSEMAILDTKSWSWVNVPIIGPQTLPSAGGTMTLFQNSKLVTAGGKAGEIFTADIGVLTNLPTSNDNIQSSKLQWFTNDPKTDEESLIAGRGGLTNGAVAGIVIACILILALVLTLLWKYVPKARIIANYVQTEVIWNPRSGEPLWAETTRLLVRFILLFLFLAFIVYVIYKSVTSPIVIQRIRTATDKVLAPDIRFCFDGFSYTVPEDISVVCRFNNGTDCSQYIHTLDMQVYSPHYLDTLGPVVCFLFLPGPSFYILDDKYGYRDSTGTKMKFYFFAPSTSNITDAVIYADMYPPEYDPNTYVYKELNETIITKLDPSQLRQWAVQEQAFNLVENSIIVKKTVVSTASYSIIQKDVLKPNDGWNYIGFSSNYDESLVIDSQYKDTPQNAALIADGKPIAELTIQPSSFTINVDREQKVFTLLNAFAQAGGVLGLFVAVQTILFGFRPQSPWGIIHRWSFGRLRTKLTDRLVGYFDRMGTPVPLVSPVSNRLGTVFKTNNAYGLPGGNVPSAAEEAMSQESRVQQVEERLQLMELLLKSYYLNDEVFRSLHQGVERGNEERRLSSFGGIKSKETDSVLGSDNINEEFEMAQNGYKKNEPSNTGIDRRPSGTVFNRPRDLYQPRLAASGSYDFNEHDNTLPKK